MDFLLYGAGTLPFDNGPESIEYVETYFLEFPLVPQGFEAEAVATWHVREFPRIKTQESGPVSGEVADPAGELLAPGAAGEDGGLHGDPLPRVGATT